MNATVCPNPKTLEAYLLGTLDPAGGDSIDAHLDECAGCIAVIDSLDAAVNQPFNCLREPALTAADWREPAFGKLVAQAKTLTGAHTTLLPDVRANQTLGNYLLLESVGSGGMGRVFKARHQRLKKTVAVKVLSPALVRSEEGRRRFRREIEAVGRLTSPHIVTAFDAGEADGRDFLVMEYVEGKNLAEIVQAGGPMPVEQALDCILQAARGLEHAHAAGIIHRDVKPSNLLLDRTGTVKVLDLGLALIRFDEVGAATNFATDHVIMGTVAFMAPEQALDTHNADERADVYSLGCTLFFLLTGRAPYAGKTPLEVLTNHREQPIPSVRALLPDCPANVDNLCSRLIAKKPADRPASMRLIIVELEKLADRKTSTNVPRRGWRRTMAACIALAACVPLAFLLWSALAGNAPSPGIEVVQKKGKSPEIALVKIAGGEFWMGASETDLNAQKSEKPRLKVKINNAFFLGKTEVTQAQFLDVMGVNPSAFSVKGLYRDRVKNLDTSNHPVESVSWFDAVRFCNRLSERHEIEPYYKIKDETVTIRGGDGYRLPTEAEWELACRGGKTTTWYFGEDIGDIKDHAWFAGNSDDRTHPVGKKKPNPFGLHDMYGNAREWCWDRFDAGYYGYAPASDPPGSGTGNTRVFRGGAWNTRMPRTTEREGLGFMYGTRPELKGGGSINIVGFRVARNVAP